MDRYFKDAENNVLLHDLRFVIEGEVTQIDHLILSRMGRVYLLETKNYACNLVINERGKFTAGYKNARFGIPSPIEQSLRHEKVLRQLLERLGIVGRTQKHPDFHHVVNAPSQGDDRAAPGQKLCGKNRHRHAFQERAEHAQPENNHRVVGREAQKAAPAGRLAGTTRLYAATRFDQNGNAGDFAITVSVQIHHVCACPLVTPASAPPAESAKRLVCARCDVKISFLEGKFCWNNAQRFSGLAYCREHQALM